MKTEGPLDDDALVAQVLAGGTDMFAHLVRRHQRDLWRIAAQAGGGSLVIEGLVQESFVNAFEHLDTYERGRDFGRWLRAIARNLVKMELRRRSREHERLVHYREYVLALYDGEDDRGARVDRIEHAVAACRAQLAPAAADVLRLRYEDSLAVEEVAASIGRTFAATRQLLFKARELVRACVARKLAAE